MLLSEPYDLVILLFDLPECGHGDNSVPESGRNGCECWVLNALLAVKHDGGENNDGHGQGKHQEPQLRGTRLQGVTKDTKTLRMSRTKKIQIKTVFKVVDDLLPLPGKLKYSEYSEYPEGDECPGDLIVVWKSETDVIWHDGHKVNDTHDTAHEFASIGCCIQP